MGVTHIVFISKSSELNIFQRLFSNVFSFKWAVSKPHLWDVYTFIFISCHLLIYLSMMILASLDINITVKQKFFSGIIELHCLSKIIKNFKLILVFPIKNLIASMYLNAQIFKSYLYNCTISFIYINTHTNIKQFWVIVCSIEIKLMCMLQNFPIRQK